AHSMRALLMEAFTRTQDAARRRGRIKPLGRPTMRLRRALPALLTTALLGRLAAADPPGPPHGGPPRPDGPIVGSGVAAKDRTAIAWFGTWKGALAEAQRSGRPILLLAAAPQCAGGISGLW